MKRDPDWIRGGDPLRTVWTGGHDLLSDTRIVWRPISRWSSNDGSLVASSGSSLAGKIVAVRLTGTIEGTPRNMEGELGWCMKAGESPEVPMILPADWSPPWLEWVEGSIPTQSLMQNLGVFGSSSPVALPSLQIAPQVSSRSIREQLLWLLCAVLTFACFLLGWLIKANTKPPIAPHLEESTRAKSNDLLIDLGNGKYEAD